MSENLIKFQWSSEIPPVMTQEGRDLLREIILRRYDAAGIVLPADTSRVSWTCFQIEDRVYATLTDWSQSVMQLRHGCWGSNPLELFSMETTMEELGFQVVGAGAINDEWGNPLPAPLWGVP